MIKITADNEMAIKEKLYKELISIHPSKMLNKYLYIIDNYFHENNNDYKIKFSMESTRFRIFMECIEIFIQKNDWDWSECSFNEVFIPKLRSSIIETYD